MHLYDGDALDELIRLALREDLGAGDVTTESIISVDERGEAVVVAKSELVLAGVDAARRVFELIDREIVIEPPPADGTVLMPGDVALRIHGRMRTLLSGERTALNFLQRLSGIATLTRACTKALSGTKTKLLDTRKTAPGWRAIEKRAVRAGGGHGHRTSLADGVMIKDNHIAAAGSITRAVQLARAAVHPLLRIEVEVTDLAELAEAIAAGADMLLLDNMNDAQLAEAVLAVAGRVPTEASGNMTLERLPIVAATGVDFVSMGALTHSAPAADLSLAITGAAGR